MKHRWQYCYSRTKDSISLT